jgi:hypothetical protein
MSLSAEGDIKTAEGRAGAPLSRDGMPTITDLPGVGPFREARLLGLRPFANTAYRSA